MYAYPSPSPSEQCLSSTDKSVSETIKSIKGMYAYPSPSPSEQCLGLLRKDKNSKGDELENDIHQSTS